MPTAEKSQAKKTLLSVAPKKTTTNLPDQDYQEMIAEAAYYRAEQRGFVPGFEEEDWLLAEYEILAMLNLH